MNSENSKSQLRKGILEYCILLVIGQNEVYAGEIIDAMKKADMIVVEGTLYPILSRMKNNGMLTYRWEESTQGPPRKYYTLTPNGQAYLIELNAHWEKLNLTIQTLKSN